ncbi:8642_t:CDS:2 [Funneliformis geosporum]|uniref:14145_t:CDS:1 n=1 Tax=Funneliformis geosporum TaxID=1117311 RepID=A0A9W4SEH4_9GLOM|nr:14145_t:CDS:2 [Funneliformis geosporum]CAI2165724.1 8642_t:CDS:2 [Funneliformis geosporum]
MSSINNYCSNVQQEDAAETNQPPSFDYDCPSETYDIINTYDNDGNIQDIQAAEFTNQPQTFDLPSSETADIFASLNTNMSDNYESHHQDVVSEMYSPHNYMYNRPIISDDQNFNQGLDMQQPNDFQQTPQLFIFQNIYAGLTDNTATANTNNLPNNYESHIQASNNMSDYHNYNQGFEANTEHSGGSCEEVEKINKNKTYSFVWEDIPTEHLLSYLKDNKKLVLELKKRGSTAGKVRKPLWEKASIMLRNINDNYSIYSEKRCEIRWKNIKQNHDNKFEKYQLDVKEILGEKN